VSRRGQFRFYRAAAGMNEEFGLSAASVIWGGRDPLISLPVSKFHVERAVFRVAMSIKPSSGCGRQAVWWSRGAALGSSVYSPVIGGAGVSRETCDRPSVEVGPAVRWGWGPSCVVESKCVRCDCPSIDVRVFHMKRAGILSARPFTSSVEGGLQVA
jgi:hypothetical protein